MCLYFRSQLGIKAVCGATILCPDHKFEIQTTDYNSLSFIGDVFASFFVWVCVDMCLSLNPNDHITM